MLYYVSLRHPENANVQNVSKFRVILSGNYLTRRRTHPVEGSPTLNLLPLSLWQCSIISLPPGGRGTTEVVEGERVNMQFDLIMNYRTLPQSLRASSLRREPKISYGGHGFVFFWFIFSLVMDGADVFYFDIYVRLLRMTRA